MTLHALGSGGMGIHAAGGVYVRETANDAIVAAPAGFGGDFAYSVDPVGGGRDGIDVYGYSAFVADTPKLMLVSFLLRIEDLLDENVNLASIGRREAISDPARQIVMTAAEKVQIVDKDDDLVGETSTGYLAADVTYWFLWYLDQRSSDTRDILWVYKDGAWDTAIDVSGHGDEAVLVQHFTIGSHYGKAPLPTTGGPIYYKNQVLINLEQTPNADAIAAFIVKVKRPTANGTDGDFNTGTFPNPDWNDVKEIPPDDGVSTDFGDVAGDQQSYEIANADGGDDVLALQVIGVDRRTGGTSITRRVYVYDGTTRDFGPTFSASTDWRRLGSDSPQATDANIFNQVNGVDVDETTFNSFEAGLEVVAISGGATDELTAIGLEYAIEDTGKVLPDDFPFLGIPPALLGRANRTLIRR